MRIVSLLPSATELVFALGLGDRLVGRTHECDFPPPVHELPAVTSSLVPQGGSSVEIDALVSRAAHDHRSLYRLDPGALERLHPDLILTQELCEVCAVAYDEVERAARSLRLTSAGGTAAHIVSLEPMTLDDVLAQLHVVARAVASVWRASGEGGAAPSAVGDPHCTGAGGSPAPPADVLESRAAEVERRLRQRLEAVKQRSAGLRRPRVFCMEWLDPPWCAGHWVPEMVRIAGGVDELGRDGGPSRRISWQAVLDYRPEVVVLMPCGYDLAGTLSEYARVRAGALPEGWQELPAVRAGQVYAVNGSAYFNRPGPRVVDGVEVLAEILHPEVFGTSRRGVDWAPIPSGQREPATLHPRAG